MQQLACPAAAARLVASRYLSRAEFLGFQPGRAYPTANDETDSNTTSWHTCEALAGSSESSRSFEKAARRCRTYCILVTEPLDFRAGSKIFLINPFQLSLQNGDRRLPMEFMAADIQSCVLVCLISFQRLIRQTNMP